MENETEGPTLCGKCFRRYWEVMICDRHGCPVVEAGHAMTTEQFEFSDIGRDPSKHWVRWLPVVLAVCAVFWAAAINWAISYYLGH